MKVPRRAGYEGVILGENGRLMNATPLGPGVYLSSARFGGEACPVVVKYWPSGKESLEVVWSVHQRIRNHDTRLAGSLPEIYACDLDRQFLIMEYISGVTLESMLVKDLLFSVSGARRSRAAVLASARTMARLQLLSAKDLGLSSGAYHNGCKVESFQRAWRDPSINTLISSKYRDPTWLLDHVSPAFFSRTVESIVWGDPQAKNVMVRPSGDVCLVDMGYVPCNPAVAISQFLVSLDRLGLRFPFAHILRRLSRLKSAFVAEYGRGAPFWVIEDCMFFYPNHMMHLMREHSEKRPAWKWYLRSYYAKRLNEFLANVDALSRTQRVLTPGRMFDSKGR